MMELPEILTMAQQVNDTLAGQVINHVFTATYHHKFTFFCGDAEEYKTLLTGKKIISAEGSGIFVDIKMEDDTTLTIGDGVVMRYRKPGDKIPDKYQLLLIFEDESFLVFTVAMYGAIFAYKGELDNMYHQISFEKLSVLDDKFNEELFNISFRDAKDTLSVKAFLATDQRFPGLGNGVLQDILYNARINPKRKIRTLTPSEKKRIFQSVKDTLLNMTELGGRDTTTDLLGNKGKYKTVLSSKTYKNPCSVCGDTIVKEAYMGGSVYYCPTCQKL